MISRSTINIQKNLLKYLNNPSFGFRYTRQYLKSLDVNKQQIQLSKQEEIKRKTQKALFNLPANQKNPNNHIKVKINSVVYSNNKEYQTKKQDTKTCAIMTPKPQSKRVFVSAIRKYIITSIKKCKTAMIFIKKQHIIDAINILSSSPKKVAKLMVPTLYNLIDHAKKRGLDILRLYVHGAIIGKTRRFKGIRYHGKGRTGRQKRDFCQIRIILYEKDKYQFYSDLVSGKCSPGLANQIRCTLAQNNASYQQMIEYSFLTTARGRQQAAEMIQRKANLLYRQVQQLNDFIPKKQIVQAIIHKKIPKAQQLIKDLGKKEESLKRRQILFKKNSAQ